MDANNARRFPILTGVLEFFILFFIFALVNVNSLIRFRQFPEVDNYSDNEGTYILVGLLTITAIILILWRKRLLAVWWVEWKGKAILIAFLFYALLSNTWTVYFPATTYKVIFLFFSTLAASYLAIRYRMRGVLSILTWVGAIFTCLSVLVVAYLPMLGVMQNEIFFGSWNGMFWHRNHAGNIFAFFSMLFLLRVLKDETLLRRKKVLMGLLYVLSVALVIGSRSATGLIVLLFLHLALGLTLIWLRFHEQMRPPHYYASAITLLAGVLVFIANRAFFFGLIGRSANMTGRVPLWQDLFNNFFLQRSLLGYGYGALWMQKSFRLLMQIRQGWGYQVYFADNGFFDILLNLGLIGFLLFLAVYIPLGVRSFRQAITHKTWLYFFPFLTFLYIFIGNLTYSFLLEVDQMVWLLLVTMVFLTTPASRARIPQP